MGLTIAVPPFPRIVVTTFLHRGLVPSFLRCHDCLLIQESPVHRRESLSSYLTIQKVVRLYVSQLLELRVALVLELCLERVT